MLTGINYFIKAIKNPQKILLIALVSGTFLMFGCGHNAEAPTEKIANYPISQNPSTLEIPITLKNAELEKKLSSLFKDPIVDEVKNEHVDVLNPAVLQFVPYTYVTKGVCDIIGRVHTGGWLCKVNPACWVTAVVGHKSCDIYNNGMHWIEKTKATRIIFDVPLHYKVRLNQVHIEGNANTLFLHIKLGYAISADVKGKFLKTDIVSCGFDKDGMAEVELLLTASININEQGNVVLNNKTWGISWPKACDLTVLNIKPQDILNLPIIQGLVDKTINNFVQQKLPNSISIKDQLEKVWPKISKPVKMDTLGYLKVNPKSLNITQIFVSKDSIYTEIGSVCSPQIIITGDTVSNTAMLMPQISNKKIGNGFNMNILASIPFKDINKYMEPIVEKYKDPIELVHINGLKCYQVNDSLVVQVSLTKPFKGTIYLWGTPKFDLNQNTLSLDNLKLTVSSKNILAKYATALLSSKIVENQVQKLFKYKYQKNLSDLISKYKYFNQEVSPNIFITAHLNKVSPSFINISENRVNVVVNMAGEAYVKLK